MQSGLRLNAARIMHRLVSGTHAGAATQGATLLAKHCTADSAEQMHGTALHSAYYLALGAAGALLRCIRCIFGHDIHSAQLIRSISNAFSCHASACRHLEMEKDTFVAAKSVQLAFIAPGEYMHIDLASVGSLELVRPLQPAAVGAANKAQGSLYGCACRA